MMRSLIAAILMGCALVSCVAAQSMAEDAKDIDLLIDARMQIRGGQIDQAEQSTRNFLEKHPSSGQAHFLLGFILFKEGQARAAVGTTQDKARASLAEYTQGAQFQRPSSLDLKVVALDYVLLADYPDADKWLTQSLSWNPKDAEAWYYLGRIRESEGDSRTAAQAFDQCLKLDPLETRAKQEREKLAQTPSGTH